MTLYSTQGRTYEIADESALGTPGAYAYFRVDGEETIPTDATAQVEQANTGHAFAGDYRDKPVNYEMYKEGAIKLPLRVRRTAATGTGKPILMRALQSAGCTITTNANDIIAGYTSESDFDLTTGNAADYTALCVELNDGTFQPALCANYTAAPDKTVITGQALPSASSGGKITEVMHTAVPTVGEVGVAETLAMRVTSNVAGSSKNVTVTATGCALASVDSLVIEPGKEPLFGLNFSTAKIDLTEVDIAADTAFVDHEKFVRPFGGTGSVKPRFKIKENSDIASPPFETGSGTALMKAEYNFAFGAKIVAGSGVTTCLNGIQKYIGAFTGTPTVKLTLAMNTGYATSMALAGTQIYYYVGLEIPTDDLDFPAFGVWAPYCYLKSHPVWIYKGKEWSEVEIELVMSGYQGTPPWIIGMSGEHTP